MLENTPPRLVVVSSEGQHYILVPRNWAGDLRIYLQSQGVFSTPPETISTELASLTLSKKIDASVVQGLLDRWTSSHG
jgi:hypothetical protein